MKLPGPRIQSVRNGKEKNTLRNQQRHIAFGIIRNSDFGHTSVFETDVSTEHYIVLIRNFVICTVDKIEESEFGGTSSTHGAKI